MSKPLFKSIHPFLPAQLVLIFFYVHHIQEYFPFLSPIDPIWILLLYSFLGWGIYWGLNKFFKQSQKSGIATLMVIFVLLFFEPITLGFIKLSLITLARVRFLIPFLTCFILAVFCLLKRSSKNFYSSIRFLTICLTALLIYESILLFEKVENPLVSGSVTLKNSNEMPWKSCDTCRRPDIYVLIVDELASTVSIKEQFGENYTYLDTVLSNLGFQVINQSRSNYNISHFSIASTFNLNYLTIRDPEKVTYQDYTAVRIIIKDNRLMDFMEKFGYSVQAHSCFHIGEKDPSPYFKIVADEKTALFSMTMLPKIWDAISWTFFPTPTDTLEMSEYIKNTMHYNDLAFTTVLEAAQNKEDRPKFVYSHILMPHYPFLMDSAGNRRLATEIIKDTNDLAILPSYLGYYKYCSRKIAELAQSLVKATKGEAIIYLIGDHGFRSTMAKDNRRVADFQNYNAIYFPDKRHIYPDSVTLVNEFRILLSTEFNQELPLLEDSVLFLNEIVNPLQVQ